MSVYALVISLALSGQVTAGDRYGPPPTERTPVDLRHPDVSPPPAFAPPRKVPSTTAPAVKSPATTAEDYGYGMPASRSPASTAPPPPARGTNTSTETGVKPAAMMRSMQTVPAGTRLTGRPVRLAEVVGGASSRQQQSQRVEAYWDLCSSVADYYLSVREQDELQRLRSGVQNIGPVWQQAESELGVRIGTSQRAAVASQYRLASLIGQGDAGSLPLPVELPHCGDYYARYDQVFAGRPSKEAQQLSELLPMRYEELSDAAMAVTRAEEFLNAIAAQRTAGDGTGTLRALELLALRRRAFVQIARDYNRRIARYTELATPGPIDSDRFIGMLILREGAANTATRPASLVPPPHRQSQLPASALPQLLDSAQTFVEGWESATSAAALARDENVKPASAESKPTIVRRERSLLVPAE